MLRELEALVDMLSISRRNLWRAIESLSPDELLLRMPGSEWSIKDALAHLGGNEALMTKALQNIATGSQESEREFDNEAENRAQIARGRQESLAEVLQDLEESRRRLLELLDGLNQEQLERRGSHPYQGEMTVREFLTVIFTHEETHTREIVEWARQLKKKDSGQV
ncbi:MAG: DinB family protein [Rudaea sp.]